MESMNVLCLPSFRGAAFPSPHSSMRFLCLRPRATRREAGEEETQTPSASRQRLRRGPGAAAAGQHKAGGNWGQTKIAKPSQAANEATSGGGSGWQVALLLRARAPRAQRARTPPISRRRGGWWKLEEQMRSKTAF